MSFFLAIGSAHLDVIAQSSGDPRGIDQPGSAKIEVGGTACNIAINWAKLDVNSRLLTICNDSALSQMIINHVKSQNVDVVTDKSIDTETGVFSAHLNKTGELTSAISHMPIENHHFSENAFDAALEDVKYVVIDCNLSAEELSAASIECLARAIPFAISGVSQEKCLKLNNVRSMPSLVCLNISEAEYFLHSILRKRIKDPNDVIIALAEHLRCTCIITLGTQGAIFYDGKTPPTWEKPERSTGKGNRLGAGDGFLAAFIHAQDVLEEKSPKLALNRAMRIATLMANKEHANLGTAHPLDKAFETLETQAHQDPLTGLANRAGAFAGLEKRKNSPDTFPLSILLLDIDHFKKVNDTLGHDQGDVALKEVSEIMSGCLRSNDIASRWGGEEFVCILPGTETPTALLIAERIRATIESAVIIENWPITVSIGVSHSNPNDTLEQTIKRADEALYNSKSAGRNKVSSN